MIVNFGFRNYGRINIAENFSQPLDYFAFGDESVIADLGQRVDPFIDGLSMIIIGGGGIYDRQTWKRLHKIAKRVPSTIPVIIWGMGINDHRSRDTAYDAILGKLEGHANVLIGLRDRFYNRWVPCASCMRDEFDRKFETRHDIVYYGHLDAQLDLPYPVMTNETVGAPLERLGRVVEFLGSAEAVVTNTYHGAYWGTLLGKRVVVIKPFSNKFFGLRHQPEIVDDATEIEAAAGRARSYENALAESRAANMDFYRKILAFREDGQIVAAG